MKLTKIISQYRRDFKGEYTCQFCGNMDVDRNMDSYDDAYYHQNVIPNQKCTKCKKSTNSEGDIVGEFQTKYPEGFII